MPVIGACTLRAERWVKGSVWSADDVVHHDLDLLDANEVLQLLRRVLEQVKHASVDSFTLADAGP